MSKRFYKRVSLNTELKKLQDEANLYGKVAVGISGSGQLYIILNNKVEAITPTKAAEYLDTTVDEIEKLIAARGDYVITDPVVEEETDLNLADENVSTDIEERVEVQHENDVLSRIEASLSNVESLLKGISKELKETIIEELKPVKDFIESCKLD